MDEDALAMVAQLQGINTMRARVLLGLVEDGLGALIAQARAGDPNAQQELANLRGMLQDVLSADAASRIAVVRKLS